MFRAVKNSRQRPSDLPISHDDYKHKKPSGKGKSKKYTIYGGLTTILILYLLCTRWNNASDTTVYTEEEKSSYNNYKFFDQEEMAKFDKGVEQYYIDNQGIVKGSPEEAKVEEEVDKLYHSTVDYYDLGDFGGSKDGANNGEHLLLLMPLRNAEAVLPLMFRHVMNLTYPHNLIDIAFLVSDCDEDDHTLEMVFHHSIALQNGNLSDYLTEEENRQERVRGTRDLYMKYMDPDYVERKEKAFSPPYHSEYTKPFRSIQIFQKDFGQAIGQGFSDRHDVKVQGIRRKLMGRARNWLTANALKPYHSWVYWRDVDIELMPGEIIQDLMKFNYDVLVPNVWRPLPEFLGNEQAYDLNSWIESDQGLELASKLNEDDVIVEGYAEYPTWRVHLGYIRNAQGNPNEVVNLDGVGGVSILAKARVFRQGVHFPAFTFLNHAETEAFGKMAKKLGFSVGGLPHYTIWHIYEPSEDDLREIARKERKKRRQRIGKGDNQ